MGDEGFRLVVTLTRIPVEEVLRAGLRGQGCRRRYSDGSRTTAVPSVVSYTFVPTGSNSGTVGFVGLPTLTRRKCKYRGRLTVSYPEGFYGRLDPVCDTRYENYFIE